MYQRYTKWWIKSTEMGTEKKLMSNIAQEINNVQENEPKLDDILSCFAEAYLNALEHGNQLSKDRQVKVLLVIDDEYYVLRVFDEGQGFCYQPKPINLKEKMKEENPRGWGLYLIYELADEVSTGYEDGKFYIETSFRRSSWGREER